MAFNITLNMDFNVVFGELIFPYDIEYEFECCVEELIFLPNIQCYIEYGFQCYIEELIFLLDIQSNVEY